MFEVAGLTCEVPGRLHSAGSWEPAEFNHCVYRDQRTYVPVFAAYTFFAVTVQLTATLSKLLSK